MVVNHRKCILRLCCFVAFVFMAGTLHAQYLKEIKRAKKAPEVDMFYYIGKEYSAEEIAKLQQEILICEQNHGKNSVEYATLSCKLGVAHLSRRHFGKGMSLVNRAEKIYLKQGKDNPQLGIDVYFAKALTPSGSNPFVTMQAYWAEAEKIAEKHFNNTPKQAAILVTLASYYKEIGFIDREEKALLKALSIYESDGSIPTYPIFIKFQLLELYINKMDMEKATPLYIELQVDNPDVYQDDDFTITYYYYYSQGQYAKAEEALQNALDNRYKRSFVLGDLYRRLAEFYIEMGQYAKAERLLTLLLKDTKKENIIFRATVLNNLGLIAERQKKYQHALYYYLGALHNDHWVFRSETDFSLTMEKNCINMIRLINPQEITNQVMLDLLNRTEKLYGENSTHYVRQLMIQGKYHHHKGEKKEAELYYSKGWELLLKKGNSEQLDTYATLARNMASLKEEMGQPEQAQFYYSKILEATRNSIKDCFTFLPAKEKQIFLKEKEGIFSQIKAFSFRNKALYPTVTEMAYDIELFHKNLLTASNIQLLNTVLSSENDSLKEAWKELNVLKEKQARNYLYGTTTEDNDAQIVELEREIIRGNKQYQTLKEDNYNWRDIQTKLQDDEAAIEFAFLQETLPNGEQLGNRIYYAIILRPNQTSPQIITCCTEPDLLNCIRELRSEYNTASLSRLVWHPIEKELEGVESVYLSPAGLLHYVPFNALKDTGNQFLIDKYNIHTVLSTKDILSAKENNLKIASLPPSITLFGGPDFDLSQETLAQVDKDLVDRGQGFHSLPEARLEADSIGKIFNELGWDSKVYTDTVATEARFKSLSSQSPSILHIATHGYYNELKDDREVENIYTTSENPLVRAGLTFSGANKRWLNKEPIIGDMEDGILCAYEISHLNLANTKLVVLSACQSGIGDIVNNEGTYGLQRAFRLAGVQSMIITLWGVNDQITCNFMTTFYHKWLTGISLQEAFHLTQKEFRDKYGDKVKEWGGVVLITN